MRATWGMLGLLVCASCGDDDDGTTFDARVVIDAPLVIADARPADAAPAVDALPPDAPVGFDATPAIDARTFDALPGSAPVIHAIVITHAQPCVMFTPSATTVEIVASDVETPQDQLVYSGTGTGCGFLTGRVSELNCPQAAPYNYTAMVRDSDDRTATRSFSINPCTNTPDAGPF